jgi:hypothetical protein
MKFLVTMVACLFAVGCARRPVTYRIPKGCMHVTVVSFTKPCEAEPNSDYMLCDKVRVKVSCIAPESKP